MTLHVSTSVGLVGAIGVFLALAIAGAFHRDSEIVRASYIAMNVGTTAVIVPLCVGALLTGVIQSLLTPWGLIRHYWVVVKLALTMLAVAVLMLHTQPIAAMADAVKVSALAPDQFYGQRIQLIVASAGALVVGLSAVVLSIFKPAGLTPYGWRKVQAQRESFSA
ncbi:MAG: hypothetical protein K1X51_03840 [Rhodospirillaceae bacterium]|nr:hypothetical protein [Rhodospirillaceae bacterium]